jgi:electron transport complex protein RnfB
MIAPSLSDRIDALLPQTQCTQCGYDGCRPYADAIAAGETAINRCPPGGQEGVESLARLLHLASLPLDRSRGEPGPLKVAVIDEAHCIGCTLCIQACPVDAIVGANKHMHSVLADWCTGCDLCVAPCPVDCISMEPAAREWTDADAQLARSRHGARLARVARLSRTQQDRMASHRLRPEGACTPATGASPPEAASEAAQQAALQAAQKRSTIDQALALARARRKARPT